MDCTGSMKDWINTCKINIKNVMNTIKEKLNFQDIEIGFIGYRDIYDCDRFEVYPFTSNMQNLENFVAKLEADGGLDTCEDIIGAL